MEEEYALLDLHFNNVRPLVATIMVALLAVACSEEEEPAPAPTAAPAPALTAAPATRANGRPGPRANGGPSPRACDDGP